MSEAFDADMGDAAGAAGAGAPWPTRVQQLGEAERLVLWAFRRWVAGPEQLPMLAREFGRQFRRADARPALRALDAALAALSRQARRTIHHHQPCCACLGADEVCILSIVAALQGGAPAAARAMAQWLVRAGGVDAFVAALADLAACLSASGLDLPYRTRQRVARAAALPAPARIH